MFLRSDGQFDVRLEVSVFSTEVMIRTYEPQQGQRLPREMNLLLDFSEEVAAFKIEEVVEAGTYKIEEVVHAETVMNSDEVRIGAAKQIIHDHNRLALILPES